MSLPVNQDRLWMFLIQFLLILGIEPKEPPPIVAVGNDDVPEVVLDPRETEEILGWKARVGFEETIYRMLSWYDEHGVSAIHSHLAEPKKLIKESIKIMDRNTFKNTQDISCGRCRICGFNLVFKLLD